MDVKPLFNNRKHPAVSHIWKNDADVFRNNISKRRQFILWIGALPYVTKFRILTHCFSYYKLLFTGEQPPRFLPFP
ncbi:hypothetical protein PDUR_22265 [Paenibacillus durus]|uniref:Uncharacterized protein n=1 Tax=Paenibacillus durus TaxID=44251 RepID=A0A089HVE8_PAEDU|nr:hypothetical protein PDUR_22265 [Paenibacillus durus]